MNLGTWRAATANEISTGHLPDGATLRQVITVGGDKEQKVVKTGSVAEVVTTTGNPTVTTSDDGSKTYTFGAGSPAMQVLSQTGNTVWENKEYSTAFTVDYKVSSYSTSLSGIVCTRDANGNYSPAGDPTYRTWFSGYKKSTLKVTGNDTGDGSAVLKFTPKAPSQGGGTVKITPSVPEETTTQKYGWFTHIPASVEEDTKVFLTQKETTAVQNFAFEGMEDFEFD